MIISHPKGNLGSPYLLANGQAVSRTTYSASFASYGTLYGVRDNVSNLQSVFLWGYGQGQTFGGTTYSTAAVGSVVNDSIIGHQHTGQSGSYLISTLTSTSTNGVASVAIQKYNTSSFSNTGGVVNGGGAETAPLHTCIYYYVLAQ